MVNRRYNVAVVGATGAVGTAMREILEESKFPVNRLRLYASARSAGKRLTFHGEEIVVEELTPHNFDEFDIALFSASEGTTVSIDYAPLAVEKKAVVIDNSSAWRMDPSVPLIVPEVNPHALKGHKGIIANPNCSTIQMVVVLYPLHRVTRIKRIVVATYQSVSGTGTAAMEELRIQTQAILKGEKPLPNVYSYPIAFNCLPHIGEFLENDYTKEEMKMVNETRKIMEDNSLRITATTVRVPVFIGHSEAVNIETQEKLTPSQAREILSRAPGVRVVDDPSNNLYPMPIDAAGRDETLVGRIRKDDSVPNGLNLWIVSDNLRKGAALNAIQIAEKMVEMGLI